MLSEIEKRVPRGQAPDQSLAEFKGAVDELRLRLWALLGAGTRTTTGAFRSSSGCGAPSRSVAGSSRTYARAP
jgi:hypothetical protein